MSSFIRMPNFEPSFNFAGPLKLLWIVFEPSKSICLFGSVNKSNIFAAGASMTIRADLILGLPVSKISARTGEALELIVKLYTIEVEADESPYKPDPLAKLRG